MKRIMLVVLQFFQFKFMFFQFKVKSCSFSLKSCSFSLKSCSVFHNTQLFIVQLQYPHQIYQSKLYENLSVKQGAAIVPLLKTLVYIYYNHGSQQEKDHKTNKMTCASSEDSDQPGHLPSLRCSHEETMGC